MKNLFLLPIIFTVIQGCSSINQPVASRALVDQDFIVDYPTVELSLSTALSNSKPGTVLSINNERVEIGKKFFAASGFMCRKLASKFAGQSLYCQNTNSEWFRVNKVISEYNDKTMSEVSL